ncbi:MAG: ATP-binding protein [Planctomycetota bacterium]
MTTTQNKRTRSLVSRGAPGGLPVLVTLAVLGPLTGLVITTLDARQAGAIDPQLAVAASIFAAAAIVLGVQAVRRLRCVAAVADAVKVAASNNPVTADELRVAERFGPSAQAWNSVAPRLVGVQPAAARAEAPATGAVVSRILNVLPDAIVLIDRNAEIVGTNTASTMLLGLADDASINDLHQSLDSRVTDLIDSAVQGRLSRRTAIEFTPPLTDAQAFRATVVPGSKVDNSTVLIVQDITRQRAAEASRGEFLAQATHELRSPLTNVRLYVDQALGEGATDETLRTEALNVISNETKRLERIVSDLLSISELESGKRTGHRGDVRLDQMLRDVQQAHERAAEQKNITLAFEMPPQIPVIKGDRDHVAMVLQNLVANAIKYTPDGGSVTVRIHVDDNSITLDVIDTGIGIDAAEATMVFDKFYRSEDQRVREVQGTGLGLAFAREVARQHGGDISLDSELNRGSTFSLRLPCGKAA